MARLNAFARLDGDFVQLKCICYDSDKRPQALKFRFDQSLIPLNLKGCDCLGSRMSLRCVDVLLMLHS